ncbi:MAG: glycosyltransferase [Candidatus Methylomirabilales bacterium]
MMRWVFLHYAYEKGLRPDAGGFRKLWELAWALQGLGEDVRVFFPRLSGCSPLRAVPASAYPVLTPPILRPLSARFRMAGEVLKAARWVRPDLFYVRIGPDLVSLRLKRALGARLVLEVNGDPVEFWRNEGRPWRARLDQLILGRLVRGSDVIIALTPGLKQMLIERWKVPSEKIVIVPSATDPEHFTPADLKEAKRKLGFSSDQPVVGFVGIFYRHQGIPTLLQAAPLVLKDQSGARFLLVGDGVMRKPWEALAEQLGVASAVSFTGQIPYQDVPRYLQAMDVVVAPLTGDRGETSPFKILDALSCGRPVVASDLPSIRRLSRGFDGAITLVPPEDPDALAETLRELLQHPDRVEALGQRGREGILRHYTWHEAARRTLSGVKRVLGDPGARRLPSQTKPGVGRQTFGRVVREAASFAPVLHLVPPPDRPQGLSAIMRVKDEETWLEPSIRSIVTVADEIIVGDNGSMDQTLEILEALQKEFPERLIVLRRPELDIKDLTNLLIEETRFRWILRWDADFVARTEGPSAITALRAWLLSLDPRRHWFAHLPMIELYGDLTHQRPGIAIRQDCHGFTYSPALRYVYDRVGLEAPLIPRWYRVLSYERPTFFHVDVKPARRMFLSLLWKRYLTDPARNRFLSFEAYVERELKTRWDGHGVEQAAAVWAMEAFRELIPYDRDRFGDYPTLLKSFLDQPFFRLRYEDGQIVGRDEGRRPCT